MKLCGIHIEQNCTQEDFEAIVTDGKKNRKIIELDITDCLYITSVPTLPDLKVLYASSCTNLSEIPIFPVLKNLYINDTQIRSVHFMEKLEGLEIYGCSNITELPELLKLKRLLCENQIKNIPFYKNLEELFIINSYNSGNIRLFHNYHHLKKIFISNISIEPFPPLENLEKLYMSNITHNFYIPNFPNLKKLVIKNMLIKIREFPSKLKNIEINVGRIKIYKENIKFNHNKNTIFHLQGRLFQNTYRVYELLIF